MGTELRTDFTMVIRPIGAICSAFHVGSRLVTLSMSVADLLSLAGKWTEGALGTCTGKPQVGKEVQLAPVIGLLQSAFGEVCP